MTWHFAQEYWGRRSRPGSSNTMQGLKMSLMQARSEPISSQTELYPHGMGSLTMSSTPPLLSYPIICTWSDYYCSCLTHSQTNKLSCDMTTRVSIIRCLFRNLFWQHIFVSKNECVSILYCWGKKMPLMTTFRYDLWFRTRECTLNDANEFWLWSYRIFSDTLYPLSTFLRATEL